MDILALGIIFIGLCALLGALGSTYKIVHLSDHQHYGWLIHAKHGIDRKTLLFNADTAMYQAKRSARHYQVYHSDMEHPKANKARQNKKDL